MDLATGRSWPPFPYSFYNFYINDKTFRMIWGIPEKEPLNDNTVFNQAKKHYEDRMVRY